MVIFESVISICSMVIQNCLFNYFSKKELKTNKHIYLFHMLVYIVCIIFFGVAILNDKASVFTLVLGLLFGVITALGNLYKMKALSSGPMHITLLIATSSMIIPTMSGVFFGEKFSILKLIVVFVLIGFIYISLDKSKSSNVNKRWILFCALAFLFQGSIGVLQKIHQSSAYRAEANVFLFVAFLCSFIYSGIMAKNGFKEIKFTRKHIVVALVCGVCTYTMNFLNLKLSGILPSQLFFPLINGSSIILNSLMSVLFFKEKISKKQLIGLCGGVISLIGICVVR